MTSVVGQAGQVARHIIAADHVEHDGDTLAVGRFLDDGNEVLGLVIDRKGGAQCSGSSAFFVASAGYDHGQAEQIAERDRHRPDSARAAMDQHGVAIGGKAALEQVDPDGEQGLGKRCRFGHSQDFGNR